MLRAEAVTKVYARPTGLRRRLVRSASHDDVTALRGIDLAVDVGEVVGLVGPNGAGKTTLIKIASTLLEATSGRITVDGFDVADTRSRCTGGSDWCCPTTARSTGGRGHAEPQVLRASAGLGWHRSGAPARNEMLATVGLADRDKLVFGYSSGMRVLVSGWPTM